VGDVAAEADTGRLTVVCRAIRMLVLVAGVAIGGTGEHRKPVSITLGCVEADDDWVVAITASDVDAFAGYIEPADGSWQVNWMTGLWADLLEPTERNRVLSRATESIRGKEWSLGLVEYDGTRFWVLGDGSVQFSTPEATHDARNVLELIARRYLRGATDVKCESPVRPPE
jgi:hypothetical protein